MLRIAGWLVTALLALPAADAFAGTARIAVIPFGDGAYRDPALVYDAAPGERNDVAVSTVDDYTLRVRDAGATVTPGPGCRSLDDRTAECHYPPQPYDPAVGVYLVFARVDAGDLDDRVVSDGDDGPRLFAWGGPRDDTITGSEDKGDVLDGGPGRDLVLGRGNSDVLSDGDGDGPLSDDVLDGGGDPDTVSYAGRTRGVTVDLGRGRGGAAGEADVLRGFQNARGGDGDDTIDGTDGNNFLRGEGGDDHLDGNDGLDFLYGGTGDDRLHGHGGGDALYGDEGADQLRGDGGGDRLFGPERGDRLACGSGDDRVHDPLEAAFVRRSCEWVAYDYEDEQLGPMSYAVSPYPRRRRRGGIAFLSGCARVEHPSSCAEVEGSLRLTNARRGTLGTGAITRRMTRRLRRAARRARPPSPLRVRVRLTPRGRRALSGRGIRATVTLRGDRLPAGSWRIRFG